jgi:hypothetical protein
MIGLPRLIPVRPRALQKNVVRSPGKLAAAQASSVSPQDVPLHRPLKCLAARSCRSPRLRRGLDQLAVHCRDVAAPEREPLSQPVL